MKVGFLITGLGIGGAEMHLKKIIPHLNLDHFVISLTNEDAIGKEIEKHTKVYYLGATKYNILAVIFRFRRIIKKERPDVLDTYLIHANLFGRIFGRLFGVKRIVNSVRNDYSDLRLLNFVDRITRGLVDLYVPNSESLKDYLIRNGVNNIRVLPNCIDTRSIKTGDYDLRKDYEITNKIVVYHGRMHRQKCLDTLLGAMKRLKNYTAVIIGDGPDRKRLEEIAPGNVIFTGSLSGKRLYTYVSQADLYVLPSRKEGMSNSLLEAMALGKICVVSDIPQNTELVKDGENGFVFRLGDESDLAKKIEKAVKSKKGVGENAREKIEREHSVEEIASKYEEIVQE